MGERFEDPIIHKNLEPKKKKFFFEKEVAVGERRRETLILPG